VTGLRVVDPTTGMLLGILAPVVDAALPGGDGEGACVGRPVLETSIPPAPVWPVRRDATE
jgi:hypothetical protein